MPASIFASKSAAARANMQESYVKEPRVFLLPIAAQYAANPTQLLVLSQIIHWFLSPSKRVDRRGKRLNVSGEGNDSDPDAKPLVKLSHRYRRRERGLVSEYLEAKPLDQIKRRAHGRTEIELESGVMEWRWSVTLPYSRWAADTGLSLRQVRVAMQALASSGWFILQHNAKREPIIVEGELMRTPEFRELLNQQAEGKRVGLLLLAKNINQVCDGDIVAAVVLKQIQRLARHHKTPSIYQTEEQLGRRWELSVDQIKRAKAKLVRLGLLVVEKAKWVGSKAKRYKASSMSVNQQRFERLQRS